jgi:hypothetical protein
MTKRGLNLAGRWIGRSVELRCNGSIVKPIHLILLLCGNKFWFCMHVHVIMFFGLSKDSSIVECIWYGSASRTECV